LQAQLQQQIPASGMTTALDHLQTSYAVSQQVAKDQNVMVRNDPPRIVFSAQPTVMAPIDGTPALAPLQGAAGFQRVINTRALILQGSGWGDVHQRGWFLVSGARTLDGPWLVLTAPPAALLDAAKAASAATAPDPLLAPDRKPPQSAPALLVTTQ